jgi:hypothetical protein
MRRFSDCVFVESQLSRRASPVVIAADVFDVLSLDAHCFAVVVVKEANEKSVQVCRVDGADDTRPAVEVRRALQTHQPNAELELHTVNQAERDLVAQGSRWTVRGSSLALEVADDRMAGR